MNSEIWNPWHGCIKYSEGCLNCYVYRRDASVGRDASQVFRTKEFDLPLRKRRDGSYALPAGYTGTVSVFCQGDRAEGVSLKGLHYELEDHVLTCDFPLGVSNSFTGQESLFSVRKGTLLILYEDHPENMDTNG